MRRPLEIVTFLLGAAIITGILIGTVWWVNLPPPEPEIVEVIVERIVEATSEPTPLKCWFAVAPPEIPMINIPLTDVGPPPAGYTGRLGYLCSDTMMFRLDLPFGVGVINVDAHLGATKRRVNGN